MLRWDNVAEQEIIDMTVKMYREPFSSDETVVSPYKDIELDHYAYMYLGSELLMYCILDVNFIEYMESRGDVSRTNKINIPTLESTLSTVL